MERRKFLKGAAIGATGAALAAPAVAGGHDGPHGGIASCRVETIPLHWTASTSTKVSL